MSATVPETNAYNPDEGKPDAPPAQTNGRRRPRKQPVTYNPRRHALQEKERQDLLHAAHEILPIPYATVPKRSVIVIGAGLAGLAAAHFLQRAGFTVTVVEARFRLGGRVHSTFGLGPPVELGAAFIHGTDENPLAGLARSIGLRLYTPIDAKELRLEDGAVVPAAADEALGLVFRDVLRASREVAALAEADVSLAAVLSAVLPRVAPPEAAHPVPRRADILRWHSENLGLPRGAGPDALSARHWDVGSDAAPHGPHDLVREGLSSVAYHLAKGLHVMTDCPVREVQYDVPVLFPHAEPPAPPLPAAASPAPPGPAADGPAPTAAAASAAPPARRGSPAPGRGRGNGRGRGGALTPRRKAANRNGRRSDATRKACAARVITASGHELLAEHVICTLPLGVLKAGAVGFSPALPDFKRDAIERIGVGLVNKVVIRFDRMFWPGLEEAWDARATASDLGSVSDFLGRVGRRRTGGDFFLFLSMRRCVGEPVVVALLSGGFARRMEGKCDLYVLESAVEALVDMYPEARAPEPQVVAYAVSRWGADRFARGACAFATVGTTPAHFDDMARPVGAHTLLFAGEATSAAHPGTAHGAFLSGTREARRVVRLSDSPRAQKDRFAADVAAAERNGLRAPAPPTAAAAAAAADPAGPLAATVAAAAPAAAAEAPTPAAAAARRSPPGQRAAAARAARGGRGGRGGRGTGGARGGRGPVKRAAAAGARSGQAAKRSRLGDAAGGGGRGGGAGAQSGRRARRAGSLQGPYAPGPSSQAAAPPNGVGPASRTRREAGRGGARNGARQPTRRSTR